MMLQSQAGTAPDLQSVAVRQTHSARLFACDANQLLATSEEPPIRFIETSKQLRMGHKWRAIFGQFELRELPLNGKVCSKKKFGMRTSQCLTNNQ